jgi:glutamyl endopeptidase
MSQLELELEEEALAQANGRPSEWELVTAGPEYTIVGPADDRVRVTNTRVEPFRHICKLEMSFRDPRTRSIKRFIGTGTLVAPAKVLTAAHCVFDRDHGFGYATSIRVIPGKNGTSEPFGSARSRRLDVPANWRTASGGRAAMPFDYAVITLDSPIGSRRGLGWWRRIGAKPDAFLRRYRINTAGYPGDKGGNTQWRVYDRVVTVRPDRLEYVLDIMGGQSGSPMWVRWRQYRKIVAIVTTHDDPLTAVVANTGVRITPRVLRDIRRWLTT